MKKYFLQTSMYYPRLGFLGVGLLERERKARDEWELCGSGCTKAGSLVQDSRDDFVVVFFLVFLVAFFGNPCVCY